MSSKPKSAEEVQEKARRLEARVKTLVGRTLRSVTYLGTSDDPLHPDYVGSERVHVIDQGVDLHLTSDLTFSIVWDWTYLHYNLNLLEGSTRQLLAEGAASLGHDASEVAPWPHYLEHEITEAQALWSHWEVDYPLGLRLIFSDHRELVALAAEPDRLRTSLEFFPHDTLALFFGAEAAEATGYQDLLVRSPLAD